VATVATSEPAPDRAPSRRWVVGVVAALAVCVGASLIAVGPSHRPGTAAAGGGLLESTSHWSVAGDLHSPDGRAIELSAISCSPADAGSCVAVGGPFVARRSDASGWTVGAAPAGAGYLTSVSCGGGGHCVAVAQPSGGVVGDLALSTADGGATWTPRRLPASVEGLSSVSCPAPLRCVAVGESRHGAVAAVTSDGGVTWVAVLAPPALGGLDAVGCSAGAVGRCIAVGWLRQRSAGAIAVIPSAAGGAWSVVPAPAGVGALDAVACPSATTCYTGGFLAPTGGRRFPGAVARTVDGGLHWLLLGLPAGAGPVNALSCPSPASCVAAGVAAMPSTGNAGGAGPPGMALSTTDAGAAWQVDVLPQHASGVAGVACSPAGCVATAAGPASSSFVLAGG
jgi:hypothetical protein